MRKFTHLILFAVLMCGGVQANAASGLWWGMESNPICDLQPGLKNTDNFDSSKYANSNGFICDEDSIMNNIAAMFGTESADLAPLKPMLADAGFKVSTPANNALSSLMNTILLLLSAVLVPAGFWVIIKCLFEGVKTGEYLATVGKYPARLLAVILVVIFLLYGGAIILYFPILGIFLGNGQFGAKLEMTFEAGKLKNTLEKNELFMISANTASQVKMAAEESITIQALFQMNKYLMTSTEGVIYGSNKITKDEALEEAVKQGRLIIDLNDQTKLNWDATTNISNIINYYNLGRRYTLTKKAPYSAEYRNVFGYETVYGTVEVGSNGNNVEQQAGGESLNDGTMQNMLRAAQQQAADTLGPKYVPYLEAKYVTILGQLEKGSYVTSDVTIDDAIRKASRESANTIRSNTIRTAELNISSPATYDIIAGVAAANIYAGARGHDMTKNGASIREQQDWFVKRVIVPMRSAVCTENWQAYRGEKIEIDKFNGIPGETPMDDFTRNNKISGLTLRCGMIDEKAHKINSLGTENLADLELYKKQALAAKLAKDTVDASIYLGIKDSLADDKSHEGALKYSVYLKAKEGLLGLGLADVEVSNYLNAQQVKTRSLNSSLYFTFKNGGIPDYNFVNMDMLFGAKDIDLSSDQYQRVADGFPIIPFNMLMISSITNVAPSSLTSDQSAASALSVAKVIGDLLAVESNAIKLMGGMDQDKSMLDGATECKNDPSVCEGNPTVNYETGMRLMGQESMDYANKVIGLYMVSKTLKEAKDLVPTVLETVTSGIGSSKVATFFKFAWSAGTALFTAAVYGGLVISSALLPVAYLNYGIGLFCIYFLPIVKIFIMIGVIIGFGWEVAVLKCFHAPWLLFRALISNDDKDCIDHLKTLGMRIFRVAVMIPTFVVVYNFLGFMLEAFVPKRIIWSILTMGDGSLISQIVLSGMVAIALLWIYFSFVKAMKTYNDEIMKALTQQESARDDNTYNKVIQIMNNTHVISAVQQLQHTLVNSPSQGVRSMNEVQKRNTRSQFNYDRPPVVPQDAGGTKKKT